ncbi:MAG: TetR/AcrR family transcriptional regulator [Bacteroidota bacterium]
METRTKILEMARLMFNEQGASQVSSRHVSEALGISYGNLCYHFPKKDELILQLYHDMQAALDAEVAQLEAEIYQFDFMIKSLRQMLAVLLKYKFVSLELASLVRRFPLIAEHVRKQQQSRLFICRAIYAFLMQRGYLKAERFPGHYDLLSHNMIMILNSWIVDAELFYQGPEEGKIEYYLGLIYRFVSASLTRKGVEAFQKVYGGEPNLFSHQSSSSEIKNAGQ